MTDLREETEKLLAEWPAFAVKVQPACESATIYEMAWLCGEGRAVDLLAAAPRLLRAWIEEHERLQRELAFERDVTASMRFALSERCVEYVGQPDFLTEEHLQDENKRLRRELEAAREENARLAKKRVGQRRAIAKLETERNRWYQVEKSSLQSELEAARRAVEAARSFFRCTDDSTAAPLHDALDAYDVAVKEEEER